MIGEIEAFEKYIIICIGAPGSGKTTFAKEWVSEDPKKRFRFNNDDLLNMMNDGVYSGDAYLIIRGMQTNFITGIMKYNKNCILDNTHLGNPSVLEDLLNLLTVDLRGTVLYKNYHIIIKDFTDIPMDECIKRNSTRENPINESTIDKMYKNIDNIKNVISKFENSRFITVEKVHSV